MRQRTPLLLTVAATILGIAFLYASAQKAGGGQQATVLMREGSGGGGTVTATSASELQIAGDDKITRTIPMTQVRSIEYDEATTPPAATPQTSPPPSAAPQPTSSAPSAPPSAPPAASEPPHVERHHPVEAAITSRRRELPA